jgi:D-glycero-alpha-D-manno-heptose-7-phosphate kinase
MKIEARAPTRIDLAGATLDIWPLYLFHEGAVTVNCAVTRYASCAIETQPRGNRRITLISLDTRRKESFASLSVLENAKRYRLPLLAHLTKLFSPEVGFTLTTDSLAPAGAGIGGSSAMAVAICAAFNRLTGAGLKREDWIHLSRDAEAMVILVPTGTQDHFPAAFGGVSAIHLRAGSVTREAIPVNLDALESRLLLCYTGKPRQSGINNWEVFQAHINGDKRIWHNLEEISAIAQQTRVAVERANWTELGRLVREEWSFRRRNLPSISTPVIDNIISAARRNGALAGKVCGAGGGGCVTLLIDPGARKRVEAAVTAAGGEILPFQIDRHGVRVIIKR